MKFLYLSALVLVSSVAVGAQQPPTGTMGKPAPAGTAVPGDDSIVPGPITLTGCVAAGTEKGTFMLTNVHRTDVAAATTGGKPVTDPKSHTKYDDDNVVYWLDSTDKLEDHVGHSVKIEGILAGDVDTSKVATAGGETTMTTEKGRAVGVPERGRAGVDASAGGEAKRLTYKVKVLSVTMLSEGCAK